MQLIDLIGRSPSPTPWQEGDNIPWHEPGFSARMLREHLSQAHDAASRRAATIDRHVAWIHTALLGARPAAVLDLGCGPGLYCGRLARLGHRCAGIDMGPASIAYARAEAEAGRLDCTYQLADLRQADYGAGFDLAMLIFGELNVFAPADARAILTRAHGALAAGGLLLLEPHTFAAIQQIGQGLPSWYTSPSGLFAETPHLVLTEHFWHAEQAAATTRHLVVDLQAGGVTRHAQSFQAYSADGYRELLEACGFALRASYPSLTGEAEPGQEALVALVAEKRRAP